jgi:nucleotide-binding universal stress UspA family protein
MIKRILVALSGTPCTTSAIQHGVELAQKHDAELTGVTIIDPNKLLDVGPIPIGGAKAAHDLAEHRMHLAQEHIEAAVAEFESTCRCVNIKHNVLHEEGDTASKLLADWRYHDLTVIGLRGLFEYGILNNHGNLVLDVIGEGLRPILAVAEEYRPIQRAMIAYDGSPLAARAMKAFCMLDVWEPMPTTITCFAGSQGDHEQLLADAGAYLNAHGFEHATLYRDDKPRPHVLDALEECGGDLLVMGAAKRSKLGRKLLGDTARYALENSTRPIFLHH